MERCELMAAWRAIVSTLGLESFPRRKE